MNPNAIDRAAATLTHADALSLAIAETLTARSTDEAILMGLQSETLAEARAALVAMCATMAGANRAACIISADAALNAEAIAKYQEAKNAGRETSTPRAVTTYILVRRGVDAAGHAFTVAKRGGEFIPTEVSASNKKSTAAKKSRAARVAKGTELTSDQAMKQIRALLKMSNTSNADTVAAVAALLKPASATVASTGGKRAAQPAKRAA